ncbi:MAG: Ig-like domain-containing protein [Thalassotalea sp.]
MNSQLIKIAISSAVIFALAACNHNDSAKKEQPKMNIAPVAQTLSVTTQTDTSVMDQLMATDADGDNLTFMLVTEPSQGVLELAANGSFTYTPNSEVTGVDSFQYLVSDGVNGAVTAMVNIDIEVLEVMFSSFSRAAFNQMAADKPLAVNGREFIQDVSSTSAYDDLLEP